SRSLFPL
ncbi:hypothetical protein D049_4375B, partial [Vibrio parahaemolyticus VPTS-2010]